MYKKAIDLIAFGDLDYKAIAIHIAKTNPGTFVKAANSVMKKDVAQLMADFLGHECVHITLNPFIFEKMVEVYGQKMWLRDIIFLMFDDRKQYPEKIRAIKLIREVFKCGLREAKEFMDDFFAFNYPDVKRLK